MNTCDSDIQRIVEHDLAAKCGTGAGADCGCGCGKNAGDLDVFGGFVTANQIEQAMKSNTACTIILTPDAKLTPAAKDYVKDKKITIHRRDAEPTSQVSTADQWFWWLDADCPTCESVMKALPFKLIPSLQKRRPQNVLPVLVELRERIQRGGVKGGVLFIRTAAMAAVVANKAPEIRAVVGTCPRAVEMGVGKAGANVLLVEYGHFGAESMANMVATFMSMKRGGNPLAEAERAMTR